MSRTTERRYGARDEAGKGGAGGRAAAEGFCVGAVGAPVQPLTSGVWEGDWSDPDKESTTTKIQLAESDVISFHNYNWPERFEARIKELQPLGRPIICTEYMARGNGSTFDKACRLRRI